MSHPLLVLIAEAMVVYLLVLWAHSSRTKVGLAHFYALLGGLTAIMSWITDAGVSVEVSGTTFMVGSTVFYPALLLAVFVIYVFDGPRATRVAISTIITMAITMPLVAIVLHWQMTDDQAAMSYIPLPSIRTNVASVLTMVADLIFLALAWEFWARPRVNMHLWLRVFLTLLAVMWLDVMLFMTGAFLQEHNYWDLVKGALWSRFIICLFASPFLYAYLHWQRRSLESPLDATRPVLAIHQDMEDMRRELSLAQQEAEHHKQLGKQLEAQVYSDELTQIANRRFFDYTFDSEWKRALRNHQPLAVIICDIDHFKLYNDHYGHVQGDECLRTVAQAIRQSLFRPGDMVARYGGEEFVVLLPETELVDAIDIAERIRRTVQALAIEHLKSESLPQVTLSLGVAYCHPQSTQAPMSLVEHADKALYRAKNAGRNRVWPHLKKVTKAFMRIV